MKDTVTVFIISAKPDPRINKRIELTAQYSKVHLIYWNRSGLRNCYTNSNCIIHEINIKTGDSCLKRFPHYHSFSREAMNELCRIDCNIIHVQGLDMLIIACKYSQKHPVKIIYEVADLPHLVIDKPSNPVWYFIQKYIRRLEEKCLKKVDLLIVTSPRFVDIRYHDLISNDKILYFANVPDKKLFVNYDKRKDSCHNFTVSYIGVVRYKQEMKTFLACAKNSKANFLIAGFETDGNEIEIQAKKISNVTWYGEYNFNLEGSKLYNMSDVIYAVYDTNQLNVRIALPNKLYEAVFCELPIIVAKNTYLAEIVEEWGIGVAVDSRSVNELDAAIEKLRNDRDFYNRIVNNCRQHKRDTELSYYNSLLMSYVKQKLLS